MLSDISFYTLGRCVKTKSDWDIINLVDTNRLYYIHSGTVIHSTGKKERLLSPGKLYFFPQNLEFKLIIDDTTKIDHTYFNFCSVPLLSAPDVLEIDLSNHTLLFSAASILLKLAENPEGREELIKSYLNNLLILISEEYEIKTAHNKVINSAIEFIHSNISSKLSVGDMADKFGFEKSVFIKKFKKHAGLTPYQYIKMHRVNAAVTLMNSTNLTASEIAEAVGYADAPSLYHALKANTLRKEL